MFAMSQQPETNKADNTQTKVTLLTFHHNISQQKASYCTCQTTNPNKINLSLAIMQTVHTIKR